LDETELCTDSEMLEAALLQRQKQQAHAERLQQQDWLLMSSYDSSSAAKQLDAVGSQRILSSQQEQAQGLVGGRGGSSISVVGSGSPAGTRNAEAAGFSASDAPVSVTSITAAALDKHMQQQQAATIVDSAALHQQQQPQSPSSAGVQGPDPLIQPSELQGHFILTGCASSFVQFARQLAASASPAAEPLTVVLLHPEHPGTL
jgi:ABC-type phosphate transport system substrate-binding protein